MAADQAVPAHIVIPFSTTIAGSAKEHAAYDQVLEVFSRPFMQAYAEAYRFSPQRTCPDGRVTDFVFTQTQEAQQVWRYPNLTARELQMNRLSAGANFEGFLKAAPPQQNMPAASVCAAANANTR